MLRPGEQPGNGIAVFPYLRTHEPVELGGLLFRSTEDVKDLSSEDAKHLREIVEALYLIDNIGVDEVVYSLLPPVEFAEDPSLLQTLENIHAVVAYCYGPPSPLTGDPFLDVEDVSMAIFSPQPIPLFLIDPPGPDYSSRPHRSLPQDQWQRVEGFEGRFNFRHAFWAAQGSRVYSPLPHMVRNLSQDLAYDLDRIFAQPQYERLRSLLPQPKNDSGTRTLNAIRWYNRANGADCEEDVSILHLGVAFETLLRLPKGPGKTDRFVENVSMLLGRVDRLEEWALQFYTARSEVVHDGAASQRRFIAKSGAKQKDGMPYRPLLDYGRQIFRLCAGTLILGASLGDMAALRDQFVTNEERLQFICKTLGDSGQTVSARWSAIAPILAVAERAQFFAEILQNNTLLGAAKASARALVASNDHLSPTIASSAAAVVAIERGVDFRDAMKVVRGLVEALQSSVDTILDDPQKLALRVVKLVDHYALFA